MKTFFLPSYITELIDKLNTAGYEAYVVGGCVRNSLLGCDVSDYDMTTNAAPDQMKVVFSDYHVIETGIKHGTLTVLSDGNSVEITTYRIDGAYADHRKPESVTFTPNLSEDLARRDFTVNAMAYHPVFGMVDLYDGETDLNGRIIRCVGDPHTRFQEDALRILRGIRFAATYGFSIAPETSRAIHDCASLLSAISGERKYSELKKILLSSHACDLLPDYFDVISVMIPSLSPHEHLWDRILTHISCAPLDFSVRMALLLSPLSPEDVQKSLQILRFDRETSDAIYMIFSHRTDTIGTDRPEIKRAMGLFGVPLLQQMLAFRKAMDSDFPFDLIESTIESILANGEAYHRGMLAVNGTDLHAVGISGRETGHILSLLLDAVMDGIVPNAYDALMEYLEKGVSD